MSEFAQWVVDIYAYPFQARLKGHAVLAEHHHDDLHLGLEARPFALGPAEAFFLV